MQTAYLLKQILASESDKHALLQLRDSTAEAVLDIIHTVWIPLPSNIIPLTISAQIVSQSNIWTADTAADNTRLAGSQPELLQFRRRLMGLNVQLSQKATRLPSTLRLTCDNREPQAVACGAYSDIYRGTYKNTLVALKTFRAFQTQTSRQRAESIRVSFSAYA